MIAIFKGILISLLYLHIINIFDRFLEKYNTVSCKNNYSSRYFEYKYCKSRIFKMAITLLLMDSNVNTLHNPDSTVW